MSLRTTTRSALLSLVIVSLGACSRQATTGSPAPQPSASASVGLPEGVTLAMVTVGDSIFKKGSCQRCHGMDAKGGERAPNLTDGEWLHISGTFPEIVNIVTTGIPKEKMKTKAPNPMRPRGGNLTDEQIRQVAAYVYSLSHR